MIKGLLPQNVVPVDRSVTIVDSSILFAFLIANAEMVEQGSVVRGHALLYLHVVLLLACRVQVFCHLPSLSQVAHGLPNFSRLLDMRLIEFKTAVPRESFDHR